MEIPSPKAKFVEDKDAVAKHQRLVDDPLTRRALDVTLAQIVESMGDSNEPTALPNYYRIQGAKQFRKVFLQLADPIPTGGEKRYRDGLDPSAETYIAPKRQ